MKPIEKEFSQGVKILLERMQNNPEEFVGTDDPETIYKTPKFVIFADLMREILRGDKVKHWDDWHIFTKAEQSALLEGYKTMMRARFDRGIMQRLLEEPEDRGIGVYPPMSKKTGKPLTANQITRDALEILEKEFDKGMLGQTLSEPKKFLLDATQWNLANKLAKK